MFVEKLKLINFRNYEHLEINFDKNINIFYGNNAQGKTNILEALYFVACGRSHRTNKDKELIRWEQQECYINTEIKKGVDLKIDIMLSENKEARINDVPAKKWGELIGNLNTVMFSPEDLKVVKEGPQEKRKFLDIGISQIKPNYFYNLMQYSKILNHRNALLKGAKDNKEILDTLPVWNNNLIEIGAKIMYYRYEYLKKIDKISKDIHKSFSNEEMSIEYTPSVEVMSFEIEKIKEAFLNQLEKSFQKDILSGYTSVGPHRDSFEIYINGINSRIYGSQGQQRSCALSLKFSEVKIFKEETGENPILLLDDVMSELDDLRQQYLFKILGNIQTFISCTNIEKYKDIGAKYFNVHNGQIKQLEEM